jgi:hypothetical protein
MGIVLWQVRKFAESAFLTYERPPYAPEDDAVMPPSFLIVDASSYAPPQKWGTFDCLPLAILAIISFLIVVNIEAKLLRELRELEQATSPVHPAPCTLLPKPSTPRTHLMV